ncbi:low temperature requirement protein A [Lactobacillus ultunensis]|uniref:Low temperature requirement protein LtrA n=1 Tax=Lactobacillus ultunensis DSM 16047 TaxID=525365 RepID=C2EN72_9LACO|nr:low temperature requirement protein A [Lactobacillus ultunensis]EEJ72008.1 low temperature requirement protein LtrA [Lactobacillus ultunensis DSM 16047]KRL80466.1 bacterial low temperature requirement protein A [Lactobacillus ultunensis DSM 16047]QQP27707.1 low temperature requirement protein A [Lactobacillus ultunensis]
MNQPLTKRVSMIELFYDLVFAYMISQATSLIHHLDHGTISPSSFIIFTIVVIVFINSWMIQSVFTNRYGQSSWTDITFYFVDMMILLYMTNSFGETSFENMTTFFLAASLLSFILLLQYLIVYFKTEKEADKQIALAFIGILLFRTIVLLIGGLSNTNAARIIALLGIIISWLMPSLTGKYTKKHPIIFSHLLERLTLLIIITFGETIIGIADYFNPTDFSVVSILIFIIVAAIFFAYIAEFDHLIEEKRTGETGNLLIYLHYFILFGLSLITVSLKFISEKDANYFFAISCLYGGLLLFYIGLTIAIHYNKPQFNQIKPIRLITWLIILFAGYIICLTSKNLLTVTSITSIVSIITAGFKVRLLYRNR